MSTRIIPQPAPPTNATRRIMHRTSGELRQLQLQHDRALTRLQNERRRHGRPTATTYRRVERLEAKMVELKRHPARAGD